MDAWLLLILTPPPQPSSIRVRVWRRLQAQGAVALKNSVYLLPFTSENYERFQWLTQEVAKSGGEATLLKVDRIENMRADEVVRLFDDARGENYRRLAERYRRVPPRRGGGGRAGPARAGAGAAEGDRFLRRAGLSGGQAAQGDARHAASPARGGGGGARRQPHRRAPRPAVGLPA